MRWRSGRGASDSESDAKSEGVAGRFEGGDTGRGRLLDVESGLAALRLEVALEVGLDADDEAFVVVLLAVSLLLLLPFAVDVDDDGSAVVDARLGGLKGKRRFFCAA